MKLVPAAYAEELQDKLSAAMQIIAALALTDDEAVAIQTESDPSIKPEQCVGWVGRMRNDLLSPEHRPHLVEVIRRQGFLMNTHSGYCTSPLEEAFVGPRYVADVTKALLQVTEAYARGEGPEIPYTDESPLIFRDMVREAIKSNPHLLQAEVLAPAREAALDWIFGPHSVGLLQVLEVMRRRRSAS